MRPRLTLTLAAALVALSGCSGGSGFSGGGKKAGAKKTATATTPAVADKTSTSGDIATEDGSTSAPAPDGIVADEGPGTETSVDPSNVKAPEWAALVDVKCDFVDMVDDDNVQIRCEMSRTDGQAVPDAELPVTVALNAPDGQPRAGQKLQDAGPAGATTGLRLGLFGSVLHKTVQLITAPVRTIASDVLHVEIGTGVGATLLNFPIINKLFDKFPVVKDGITLATCLATSGVPAWCFVKFGLNTADRLVNSGGRPDARALVTIYAASTGTSHYYTGDPNAPGMIGPAFTLLRDQLPGTREVWLCLFANRLFFVSDQTCDGNSAQAARLGFAPASQREGTVPLYRCRSGSTGDLLASTDLNACAAVGYGSDGQIFWVPTGGYVHAAY
jgi:hypothetical protein